MRTAQRRCLAAGVLAILLMYAGAVRAEHEGKLQIVLLGDSTTAGSICHKVEPERPQLEDVIRLLLAAEKDLPPVHVINQGNNGEWIDRLFSSGRYEHEIANLPGVDFIIVRYGPNDFRKREDFANNFPKDFQRLIEQLRHDFPQATIIPATSIPYLLPEQDGKINDIVRQVASQQQLSLLDLHTRYRAELARGTNMLNYRRYPLEKIPQQQRAWLDPYIYDDQVIVMDNRLDAHFGGLPGWFDDRHPNPAGYHVIADETAKFLIPLIRERQKTAVAQ